MARALPDLKRRTVTVETQTRSIDIPTDEAGRIRRSSNIAPQFRAANSDGSIPFAGDFLPYNQRSWIGSKQWGFWETYERGLITKTISDRTGENNDITFNRDHDNRLLLARTSNGTLRLSEGTSYAHAEAEMGNYTYARDVAEAIARRDLTGMSFAFDMTTYEWSIAEDGKDLLTLREIELYDVAVVGLPANVDTSASLRMDLLSVARSQGFDAMSFDGLARRLAAPDAELVRMLRDASRPAAVSDALDEGNPLVLATLAARMAMTRA